MDSKIKKTYLLWIAYLLIEILLIYILKYKVSKKSVGLALQGYCTYTSMCCFVSINESNYL